MRNLKLWWRDNWIYVLVVLVVTVFEIAVRAGWWLPEKFAPLWYVCSACVR